MVIGVNNRIYGVKSMNKEKNFCMPKGYCEQCGKADRYCKCNKVAETIGEIIGCIIASGPIP